MNNPEQKVTPNNGVVVEMPERENGKVKIRNDFGTLYIPNKLYNELQSENQPDDNKRIIIFNESWPDDKPNHGLMRKLKNFNFKTDKNEYEAIFFNFNGNDGLTSLKEAGEKGLIPLLEKAGVYSTQRKVIMAGLSKGCLIGDWAMLKNDKLYSKIAAVASFGPPLAGTPMGSAEEVSKLVVENQRNYIKRKIGLAIVKGQEKVSKGAEYDKDCAKGLHSQLTDKEMQKKLEIDKNTVYASATVTSAYMAKRLLLGAPATIANNLFRLTSGAIPQKYKDIASEKIEKIAETDTVKKIIRGPQKATKRFYNKAKSIIPEKVRGMTSEVSKNVIACCIGSYVLNQGEYKGNHDGVVINDFTLPYYSRGTKIHDTRCHEDLINPDMIKKVLAETEKLMSRQQSQKKSKNFNNVRRLPSAMVGSKTKSTLVAER